MPPAPPARGFSTSPSSDSSEEPALIGQVLGNRYRILSILGSGGMGMVYEAEHLGLERPVAVKVLNPLQAKKKNTVKRFQQEARAAGGIGHPNICEVYDMGWLEDGCPYLVMERLHGQTLADRVRKSGGLPFLEAVEVMCQVLAGLMAAHEKGIMHRDIKPENIFLSRRPNADPIAKILDFGVSKGLAGGPEEPLDLTRTGMVMGTPYYMSPEQARGERNLDVRVDVYACGVMLYECLTGRRPFVAPNYNALLLQILTESPRPARDHRPDLPPAFEAVMRRAMARSRDDRYPTAAALRRDLIAIGKQLGMAAEPSAGRRLDDPAARPVTGGHVRPAMPVQQAQPQQPPQAPPQPHAPHAQHPGHAQHLQPQHPQHAQAPHPPQHAPHAPQPHVQPQHAQPVQPAHKPAKPTQLPAHPTLASPQHPLHAQAPSYAHNVQHAPSASQGAPQPAPQAPLQSRAPAAPRPAAGMPARPPQAPQAPPVPQTPKPQTALFSPQAPQAPQAPGGVINPNAPSKRRQTVRMTSPVANPSASQAGYLPPLPMPPAPAHAQPPRPSPPSREEKLRAPLAGSQPRGQESDELPKLYDTSPSTDGTPSRSVHERKALGAAFDARVAQSRAQTAPPPPPHASSREAPVRAPISNRAPAPPPAPPAPHAGGQDFSDAPTYVISRDEIMGAMASHLGPQSSGPTEVSEWDAETTVTTAPPDWHELVHGHGAHELDRDTDAGEASYHPVAPYSPPAPPPPAAGRPAQKPSDAHADLQRRLEDEYGDMPLDDATLVHRGRLPRRK